MHQVKTTTEGIRGKKDPLDSFTPTTDAQTQKSHSKISFTGFGADYMDPFHFGSAESDEEITSKSLRQPRPPFSEHLEEVGKTNNEEIEKRLKARCSTALPSFTQFGSPSLSASSLQSPPLLCSPSPPLPQSPIQSSSLPPASPPLQPPPSPPGRELFGTTRVSASCKNQLRTIVNEMKYDEKATGLPLLNLSLGDMTVNENFRPPKEIESHWIRHIMENKYTGYAHSSGVVKLRETMCDLLEKRYSSYESYLSSLAPSVPVHPESVVRMPVYNKDDIVMTAGCSLALNLAIESSCEGGRDRILLPSPCFPLYESICNAREIEFIKYPLLPNNNWEIDINALITLLNENNDITAIVINNPNNPTGMSYSIDHILRVLLILSHYKVVLISDEIYVGMIYANTSFLSFSAVSSLLHVLSKRAHSILHSGLASEPIADRPTHAKYPTDTLAVSDFSACCDTCPESKEVIDGGSNESSNEDHHYIEETLEDLNCRPSSPLRSKCPFSKCKGKLPNFKEGRKNNICSWISEEMIADLTNMLVTLSYSVATHTLAPYTPPMILQRPSNDITPYLQFLQSLTPCTSACALPCHNPSSRVLASIVEVNGVSKIYMIPGWRVGWVIVHDELKRIENIRNGLHQLIQITLGPNTLLQQLLIPLLLNTPHTYFISNNKIMINNISLFVNRLYKNNVNRYGLDIMIPNGSMYMIIGIDLHNFSEFRTDFEFCKALLMEVGVFVLPGSAFSMLYPSFRVVIGTNDYTLVEAADRIAVFAKRHYRNPIKKLL